MKYSKYSVAIIGSGIAGLYAALKISQKCDLPDGLLLITKSKLGESNSRYAQGGIVAVLKENKKDSPSLHISDTIKAGAGLSELGITKFISENSDEVIKDLISFGVEFDKNGNDNYYFTLEAAHSVNRILHSGGDATGRSIEKVLCQKVLENSNIEVYEQTLAVELLVDSDSECKGFVAYNDLTKEYEAVYSSAVILASGGLGQLYKHTTNPTVATGDGIALAYNAGAIIQDMEFVQFHPTALALDTGKNRFLISEAVRGEGAKLVDKDGHEFMQKYHEQKELAPRDIVTRAIFNEMNKTNSDCVYLNSTHLSKKKLQKRFPNITRICEENGIDISKDFIPVAPAAHYSMGGVKTNVEARTSIRGLYAIGETASTGLHGANRLASNSLLECVVCAYELADYLKETELNPPKLIDENLKNSIDKYSKDVDFEEVNVDLLKSKLQNLMWDYVGILRDEKSLTTANNKLHALKSEFKFPGKCSNKEEYEFKNMLTVAQLIIDSALKRTESRGAHFRKDYPWAKENVEHNCIIKGEKGLVFVS
ncbi:MAG TPA: L-aspartate oxidase [Candidatus Gastranaerophilaceae bacterium]|nr:L-aspartate oxidase [Candidatus Gastranaerophilaceae bacterium]HPT42037.1 L-aspartate oxidase [Candidatus Gastranaerophilaceae bacterium]